MKRTIIRIDEALCNGCGECITGCHEGALQLINGKARLISEQYCDGLGACIGECPVGAITLEEREAEAFDEEAVNERQQAAKQEPLPCGCPGSMMRDFRGVDAPAAGHMFSPVVPAAPQASELRQFPVQLHLLNPGAPFLQGANLLLAADCTAFACGDFHNRLLKGKALAIACPKLDNDTTSYVDRLAAMIDQSGIDTLTVAVMEVPCCGGLVRIAQTAREKASRKVPMKVVTLSVRGGVIGEEWV